jgi:hypothetical protein
MTAIIFDQNDDRKNLRSWIDMLIVNTNTILLETLRSFLYQDKIPVGK